MLPTPEQMQWCITDEDGLVDGAFGFAIGDTEDAAWARAVNPAEDWAINRAKDRGMKAIRCAIMLINP